MPVFYLLAGPNGAGKSTLYRAAVQAGLVPADAPFVNADLHERQSLTDVADPHERSRLARLWADERRAQLLAQRTSFVSETVFSHPSKLALLQAARAAVFQVVLLVVCVDEPALLVHRVELRVQQGGHPVSPDRILGRYPRTLANLHSAMSLVDLALLYDTSAPDAQAISPPVLVARVREGSATVLVRPLPRWAQSLIGN